MSKNGSGLVGHKRATAFVLLAFALLAVIGAVLWTRSNVARERFDPVNDTRELEAGRVDALLVSQPLATRDRSAIHPVVAAEEPSLVLSGTFELVDVSATPRAQLVVQFSSDTRTASVVLDVEEGAWRLVAPFEGRFEFVTATVDGAAVELEPSFGTVPHAESIALRARLPLATLLDVRAAESGERLSEAIVRKQHSKREGDAQRSPPLINRLDLERPVRIPHSLPASDGIKCYYVTAPGREIRRVCVDATVPGIHVVRLDAAHSVPVRVLGVPGGPMVHVEVHEATLELEAAPRAELAELLPRESGCVMQSVWAQEKRHPPFTWNADLRVERVPARRVALAVWVSPDLLEVRFVDVVPAMAPVVFEYHAPVHSRGRIEGRITFDAHEDIDWSRATVRLRKLDGIAERDHVFVYGRSFESSPLEPNVKTWSAGRLPPGRWVAMLYPWVAREELIVEEGVVARVEFDTRSLTNVRVRAVDAATRATRNVQWVHLSRRVGETLEVAHLYPDRNSNGEILTKCQPGEWSIRVLTADGGEGDVTVSLLAPNENVEIEVAPANVMTFKLTSEGGPLFMPMGWWVQARLFDAEGSEAKDHRPSAGGPFEQLAFHTAEVRGLRAGRYRVELPSIPDHRIVESSLTFDVAAGATKSTIELKATTSFD